MCLKHMRLLKLDLLRYRFLCYGASQLSLFDYIKAPFHLRTSAVFLYRLSCFFRDVHLKPVSMSIALINFYINGIEFSSSVKINGGLFLPHPNGIVVGASEIGRNVTLYQGVTLGAKFLDFKSSYDTRPNIGDDVVIASGAKILGGIKISSGTIVAANSVLLESTVGHSLYGGIPAKFIKLIEPRNT